MGYLIKWPKHYKPLPEGFTVEQLESGHYYAKFQEVESEMFCDRFEARRWCFAYNKNIRRIK